MLMNKHIMMIIGVFLLIASVIEADTAGVEYLYTCPCCGERFMGYHIRGGDSAPEGEKEIVFDGSQYDFILPTESGAEYDTDMCYVFEGANKYAVSIITCPYCGFSFTHNHCRMKVPDAVKEKVFAVLKPAMIDLKREYELKVQQRKNEKIKADEKYKVNEFSFQTKIPISVKFNNALQCYQWLNYSPAFLARLAVYGAWGYRTEICRPFTIASKEYNRALQSIDRKIGPYQDELQRIEKNESFRKQARLREILEEILAGRKLSKLEEAVVYSMLIGINDRLGRYHDVQKYIKLGEIPIDEEQRVFYYIKEIEEYYSHETAFLEKALNFKKKGFSEANYARPKLLNEIYLVGEFSKRTGNTDGAIYWFSLLAGLPDTPRVLKGSADLRLEELKKITAAGGNSGGATPQDRRLGDSIKDGLGNVEYYVKNQFALKKQNPEVCKTLLKRIGNALLVFKSDKGYYPDSFQQLWDENYIQSPILVNYFCCPVSGKPYLYTQPKTGFFIWPILTDTVPHPWITPSPLYGVFSTNGFFTREAEKPKEVE